MCQVANEEDLSRDWGSCGIIRIIVIIFKIAFFFLRVALSMSKVASPDMHVQGGDITPVKF